MANLDDCKLDKSKLNLDLLIRAGLVFFSVEMCIPSDCIRWCRCRPFLLKHVPLTFKPLQTYYCCSW